MQLSPDSITAINNRIKKMDQELKNKKISIVVETDTISSYGKAKKAHLPGYIKAMNRHLKKNSRLKIVKSEGGKNLKSYQVNLRQHMDNFH